MIMPLRNNFVPLLYIHIDDMAKKSSNTPKIVVNQWTGFFNLTCEYH